MFDALLRIQLGPIIDRLLELEAEVEDLNRRAESFCRIGTCQEVDAGAGRCRVTHGELLTPPIKFFNPSAGEQSETRIPSVGEQCLLLNYGGGEGSAQSVALFGLNSAAFPPVSDVATLTRRTYKDGTESSYDALAHALDWKNGPATLRAAQEGVELKVGAATLSVKPDAIELKVGAVGMQINATGVHFLGPLVDHQGKIISTA